MTRTDTKEATVTGSFFSSAFFAAALARVSLVALTYVIGSNVTRYVVSMEVGSPNFLSLPLSPVWSRYSYVCLHQRSLLLPSLHLPRAHVGAGRRVLILTSVRASLTNSLDTPPALSTPQPRRLRLPRRQRNPQPRGLRRRGPRRGPRRLEGSFPS